MTNSRSAFAKQSHQDSIFWQNLFVISLTVIIPLFFPFGKNLEYEFATATGCLVITMLSFWAVFVPNVGKIVDRCSPLVVVFFISAVLQISAIVSIWRFGIVGQACSCSGPGTAFWLILQVLPALVLGYCFFWGVLYLRVRQKMKKSILFLGVILVHVFFVGIFLLRLFVFPQVHQHHLYFGFIHGPIYDHWIPVDHGIVLARTAHLFLALTVLLLIVDLIQNKKKFFIAMLSGVTWVILAIFSLQFSSVKLGHSALSQVLPEKSWTSSYTLHYTIDNARREQMEAEIRDIELETQFHVKELGALFGSEIPHVHIYVYPDAERKKLWFGGGATDVTDVHTPSIHITSTRSPHPTLRHELVHALSSRWAFGGLGFHPNLSFTEGLAVALAPENTDLSLQEGAAHLIRSGRAPSFAELFSPLFWISSGERSYTMAGAIMQFLLVKYGSQSILKLYSGESWENVFGLTSTEVLAPWIRSIEANPNKETETANIIGEALFRSEGALFDKCPHSQIDLKIVTSRNLWTKLRLPLGWDSDSNYWPWRKKIDPQNRNADVAIFRKRASTSIDPSMDTQPLVKEIISTVSWPPRTIEEVELKILIFDLFATREFSPPLLGEMESVLKDLIEAEQKFRLGENLRRAIYARSALLSELKSHPSNVDLSGWFRFLAGWASQLPHPEKNATIDRSPWIMQYLWVRHREPSWSELSRLRSLRQKQIPNNKLRQVFQSEWHIQLSARLYENEDYEGAAEELSIAAQSVSSGKKEFLEQEVRRMRSYAAQ